MKNYNPSFTFIKQNDNEIVAKSLDGTHTFVLPFDLDSEDFQEKMFKHLLNGALEQHDGARVAPTQFEDILFSFDDITDRNVAKAICDRLIELNYCTYDSGKVAILEEIDETNLDNPILIKKWITFYEIAIERTENAKDVCVNASDEYYKKKNQMPDSLSFINLKREMVDEIIDSLGKMAEVVELTHEERDMYREATVDFFRYTRLINREDNGTHKILEYVMSHMKPIQNFLYDVDLYIRALNHNKTVFKLSKEMIVGDLQYAIELSKTVATFTTIDIMNGLTEEELSDENFKSIIKKCGENTAQLSENIDVVRDANENI